MKDGDDLESVAPQPVWNHVGCAWNHELARARDSPRTPEIRQHGQTFDRGKERLGYAGRRAGIVAGDVGPKVGQVTDRARRPDGGHARGAFRSRVLPHERTQADTFL